MAERRRIKMEGVKEREGECDGGSKVVVFWWLLRRRRRKGIFVLGLGTAYPPRKGMPSADMVTD
jgi:hypothetical protein